VRRMACADLPAFPLQVLLRDHPDWIRGPAAVVEEDKPQGRILFVNEPAYRLGILPGVRYAAALSLARDLRAGVVTPAQVQGARRRLLEAFDAFTPRIIEHPTPGGVWLDGGGLETVFTDAASWGRGILLALEREGFTGRVVVGWSRFATHAVARGGLNLGHLIVFRRPDEEAAAAKMVMLDRLDVDPDLREALKRLGLRTVGAFATLPEAAVLERFGEEAARFHREITEDAWDAWKPGKEEPAPSAARDMESPQTAVPVLLHVVGQLLPPLLQRLQQKDRTAEEIRLLLTLETGEREEEVLRPATPTLDIDLLMEIIQLRLEARSWNGPVVELGVSVHGRAVHTEQLELFATASPRDEEALQRALARLRASFGDESVVRADLREGHLPERSFDWVTELFPTLTPEPTDHPPALIRRFLTPPVPCASPLPSPIRGPYVVSGGWWRREVHRSYHFLETPSGEQLWAFFDRPRRRWFLQGRVE
jgi:protein ImuB